MNEYREDKIVEDSDDEKRIAKAVATGERKAAQLKTKSHSGRGGYNQSRPADVPSRTQPWMFRAPPTAWMFNHF